MLPVLRAVAMLLLMTVPAAAQELAATFDQLRVLVGPGDTLTITRNSGTRLRGTLSKLSPASLVLDISGVLREYQSTEVDTIEKKGADSLKNGALTGMGIGSGLALVAIAASAPDGNVAWAALGVLAYGGIGAGIGAGFDALVENPRIIYARSHSLTPTVTVAPILGRNRKGFSVSFRR